MSEHNRDIEDLGLDAFFEPALKELKLDVSSVARVIAEHKEAYRVRSVGGEFLAKITGKQRFKASSRENYPAVGDWVAITPLDREQAVINRILPRKTLLQRKYSDKQEGQIIAVNIDTAFVIESVDRDYNLNRLERYFVLAKAGNVVPAALLNKADLIADDDLHLKIKQIQDRFGDVDIIATSAVTGRGLDKLAGAMKKGKTYCFLGSSGVGKSSLINRLLGRNDIRTGEISRHTGKGKHTTTGRETYFLENGAIVIDTPGIREVGLADSDAGIKDVFADVSELSKKCKFSDCAHKHEPGCAVLRAIESGELGKDKYSNYLKLKKEAEYYDMTDLEKRRKDRKFGKFVKKILEQKNELE